MSEQRAVPEIPEDFTVRCHDCGGTQIWKRVNAGEIETYHGCFNGKQSREAFATLTAERDALAATLRQGAESDTDLRTRYEALERENVALKAQVARLSAPVTVQDLKRHGVQGLCAASAARGVIRILASRTAPAKAHPPQKEGTSESI